MLLGDLEYANEGKTRDKKLSGDLETILKKVATAHGYDIKVTSGGQTKKKRTGSDRHDDGHAGDMKLYKDGKLVDIEQNKATVAPFFTDLVKEGVTSIGYHPNYMGTSTFHADNAVAHGKGVKGVRTWGAGNKSATTPAWLKEAVDQGYKAPESVAAKLNGGATSSSPTAGTKLVKEGISSVNAKVPSQPVFNSQMPAVRPPDVPEWSSSTLPKLDSRPTMTRMDNMPEGKGHKMVGKLTTLPTPALTAKETEPSLSTKKTVPKIRLGDMTPYLSNIANALQKPAPVPNPIMDRPVQLEKVNRDNDRYEIQKDYRGTMLNADKTLDGNTSVAVKQFGKAQKFAQMSAVNQAERNQNNEIGNKEIMYNSGIAMGNNAKLYENRVNIADRENAIKRERSANFANATDKMVAQQNVKSQEDLENRKLDLLSGNDTYGTYQRMLDRAEEAKKKRETYGFGGKLGGRVPRFSAGSFMTKFKPSM